MKKIIGLIVLCLVLVSCLKREQIKGDVLIKDVHIVGVEQGRVTTNQNLVILEDRIVHIDSNAQNFDYKVTEIVDGSGKYVIPGLWDMHAHPDDPEVWRMKPEADKRDLLMPLFVVQGVTGIRDMAGSLDVVKAWRKQYQKGELLVPKIFAGGPLLDGPNPMWDGSVGIDSPEKVKPIVDSLITEGVDFLKVYSLLPRDTYLALSAYANEIYFPFVGHVPFTVPPSEAAETGMKSQEHLLEILKECADTPSEDFIANVGKIGNGIDRSNAINAFRLSTFNESKADSLYDLFVEKEIWHCPTLSMWYKNAWYESELLKDKELLNYLPKYLQKYWTPEVNDHLNHRDNETFIATKKELYKLYLKMVKRMNEKGVMLLAGTDTGANPLCFPGIGVHNELEALVDAGLSPAEALKTATINPAVFLEVEKDYGSVSVGKIADLVLLSQNPLEDINNVRKISAVIREGQLFDAAKIIAIKDSIKAKNSNTQNDNKYTIDD